MRTKRRVTLAAGCVVALIAVGWVVSRQLPRTYSPPSGWRGVAAPLAPATSPALVRPSLWLLSVGVSRYRESRIALQFADADARAVAEALQAQASGPMYREVKAQVLLNAAATRASIIGGIKQFLGQAGPDDVAVIFLAGHGVRDQDTGSYYFLPFPATGDNLHAEGLRMSDFNEMVTVLRHNVHRVVVMLDTCHAGALDLGTRALPAGEELAAQVSVSEGLFLLAASKPGERSKEDAAYGHGAFTYALLMGLQGSADADLDGVISVSDLFAFTARQVPVITGGRQHPYHKIEGTDLAFVAVTGVAKPTPPTSAKVVAQAPAEPAATPVPNTVGVVEFRNLRPDPEHDWIGQALRAALNTELGKVPALRVVAPQVLERRMRDGLDDLNAARELGIAKLLTGTFAVVGNTLRVDAGIIDTATGIHEGSDSTQGEVSAFFDLEKRLVFSLLQRLPVQVSPDTGNTLREETNTDVDAYRLLLEVEGLGGRPVSQAEQPTAPTPPGPTGKGRLGATRGFALCREVFAADAGANSEASVESFLEEYRRAHEEKNVEALAALYVSFSDRQREAIRAYLRNASNLSVEFADLTIQPGTNDATVSYTRRDRFTDKSGKSQRLEVQVTKTLVREDGRWKIASDR